MTTKVNKAQQQPFRRFFASMAAIIVLVAMVVGFWFQFYAQPVVFTTNGPGAVAQVAFELLTAVGMLMGLVAVVALRTPEVVTDAGTFRLADPVAYPLGVLSSSTDLKALRNAGIEVGGVDEADLEKMLKDDEGKEVPVFYYRLGGLRTPGLWFPGGGKSVMICIGESARIAEMADTVRGGVYIQTHTLTEVSQSQIPDVWLTKMRNDAAFGDEPAAIYITEGISPSFVKNAVLPAAQFIEPILREGKFSRSTLGNLTTATAMRLALSLAEENTWLKQRLRYSQGEVLKHDERNHLDARRDVQIYGGGSSRPVNYDYTQDRFKTDVQ